MLDSDTLLSLARRQVEATPFCVAVTAAGGGDAHARIVQPRAPGADWTVDFLTNRRCRKVREMEASGRLTLLYDQPADRGYVCLIGAVTIVDDRALKRSSWTAAHDRWNPLGPKDPETVYARLCVERIELWSAGHGIMPEPQGYSATVLTRDGDQWLLSAT